MATIYRANPHLVPEAATVSRPCLACGNVSDWQLHYTKEGFGVGVPIVSLFTDKAVLAKKTYYLLCPVCSDADPVSRDAAEGLIAKGA